MTDLSVIILVGREELHIRRCLEKLAPLEPRQIFVVESQHGDNTHNLAISTARSLGWQVKEGDISSLHLSSTSTLSLFWRDWPGTQAAQFNWALDDLPIESEWILRLDADEYLTPETVEKLKVGLDAGAKRMGEANATGEITASVAGLTLELKRRFCGGEIRHATNGIRQVRLFRRGQARYDETLMDEHLVVQGKVEDFDGAFYDDSLMPMSEWREKHRKYAKREAEQALTSLQTGKWIDPRKAKYYRLPPYLRAFAYFAIRYFLKGGILDGYAGWMWNFWQGLWYRCLVDREISRLKRGG